MDAAKELEAGIHITIRHMLADHPELRLKYGLDVEVPDSHTRSAAQLVMRLCEALTNEAVDGGCARRELAALRSYTRSLEAVRAVLQEEITKLREQHAREHHTEDMGK